MTAARSPAALVALFCTAEMLSMAGFALAPSLLPEFSVQWGLSATDGGWLGGIFFLGYLMAVPVLVSLTDRIDARRIYLACAALSGCALAGFGLLARGFESALCWWWLAGVGLAGTYMPGLKALTDRLPVTAQSRGTAFYTASFGVGAGLSYLWIEGVRRLTPLSGWPALFAVAALCAGLAALLVHRAIAERPAPRQPPIPQGRWRSVLRDRRILAFCGAYFGHNWELFGFRSWLVAYLVWMHGLAPDRWTAMPGLIAALATFLAVPASILGNEGAHRWGRSRWLNRVMPLSGGLALLLGLAVGQPAVLLVPLLLLYAVGMNLDSAALTAGLLTETPPEKRGAALALYSAIGFAGAFAGPVAFGIALDAFGRTSHAGWAAGFVTLAVGIGLGRRAIGGIAEARRAETPETRLG